MNLYFEYPDIVIGRTFAISGGKISAKYCARYDVHADEDGDPKMPLRLMALADRIWQEDATGVKFIKNRNGFPETTPVDSKEFLWIKLSAKEV